MRGYEADKMQNKGGVEVKPFEVGEGFSPVVRSILMSQPMSPLRKLVARPLFRHASARLAKDVEVVVEIPH